MIIPQRPKHGYYTIKMIDCERHFLTMWELIAFLSKTDLITQKN